MNHKGSNSLIGDNIILRMFNIDDVKDVFNSYYNNPINFEFESKKSVKTYDELISIINAKLNNYRRTNYYDYIITLNDNTVVGEISIPYYDDLFKTVEVSLIYNDNYINYINEALILFMEFIFEEVNANRVEFKVRPDNRLNKLLKNLNIHKEGLLREKYLDQNKKLVDCNLYSILRSEFNENNRFNSNI